MIKHVDDSLNKSLSLALSKMVEAGYSVSNRVSLQVDPTLRFMGYAKQVDNHHVIVVAEWALDSDMLGGFLLHELSHIYHTERGSPSHNGEIIQKIIEEIVSREGMAQKEARYLVDAFNHFQNILADDIVFNIMRGEREVKQVQRFFAGWISDRPSGDGALDAALLARNAFAIASLKRRDLFDGVSEEITSKNKQFLSILGGKAQEDFELLESFLENARSDMTPEEFHGSLAQYLEQIVMVIRRKQESWGDLR